MQLNWNSEDAGEEKAQKSQAPEHSQQRIEQKISNNKKPPARRGRPKKVAPGGLQAGELKNDSFITMNDFDQKMPDKPNLMTPNFSGLSPQTQSHCACHNIYDSDTSTDSSSSSSSDSSIFIEKSSYKKALIVELSSSEDDDMAKRGCKRNKYYPTEAKKKYKNGMKKFKDWDRKKKKKRKKRTQKLKKYANGGNGAMRIPFHPAY